jgi:hypothetical protein
MKTPQLLPRGGNVLQMFTSQLIGAMATSLIMFLVLIVAALNSDHHATDYDHLIPIWIFGSLPKAPFA